MKSNREVYNTALGYLKIAELAEEVAIEVHDFRFAYNSNLAFSIELFIKSLVSLSKDKVILEIGSTQITKKFAKSDLKGHPLRKLFDKLPQKQQYELSRIFAKHDFNIDRKPLKLVLLEIENAFVENRYVFEKVGVVSVNESELLLWTARFFRDALTSN